MANNRKLSQLLAIVAYQGEMPKDVVISGLSIDSRQLKTGDLFLALDGHQKHGYEFAEQAERQGAAAILAESPIPKRFDNKTVKIPVFEVENLSGQLGELAADFYNNPSNHIKVIAITGTNGKTSTAWLLVQALQDLGRKAAYMGTLGVGDIDSLTKTSNTTPSALDIHRHLNAMVDAGYEYVHGDSQPAISPANR